MMLLKSLLNNLNYSGEPGDCKVSGIVYNSQKVKEGFLFVAIVGLITDGHNYISDAIEKGAAAVITDGRVLEKQSVPIIGVKNPRQTLSKLVALFFKNPSKSMKIIGITGTNGKTSITQLIYNILLEHKLHCATLGTLGFMTPTGMQSTRFTTPESVEIQQLLKTLKDGGVDHVAMEISSIAIDLHRVDDVDVDFAIFTNLTPEHLDYHRNIDDYFQAKLKLFKNLTASKNAIINIDDPKAEKIIKNTKANLLTYGFSQNADIHPLESQFTLDGTKATIKYNDQKINISSPLIGEFNLSNIMASVAAALLLKIPIDTIENAIRNFTNIPGRMENINFKGKGKVFIDYAHTPDSYHKVLHTLKSLANDYTKIFTVFGCGGDRDRLKRPLMGQIAERFSNQVFITSDNPRHEKVSDICDEIISGIDGKHFEVIIDRTEAIKSALNRMDENTILMIFGKGREEYEIIGDKKYYHSDIQTVENFLQ